MAKRCGLSQTAVARIWKAFALQPHRASSFKLSKDPLFIEKVRDIVGLYLHPPDKALVLCVDEKSQIRALQRTAPLLPMRLGQIERRTHDHTRHGTTSLCAALDAKSGEVIRQCQARHRAPEFRRFLNTIDANVPEDLDVHVILENYGTHKAPTIRRWLAAHPRYHLYFTPTSASWINLVERWFGELDRKQLRRGNFHGTDELVATIMRYVGHSNVAPKPFVGRRRPAKSWPAWPALVSVLLPQHTSHAPKITTARTILDYSFPGDLADRRVLPSIMSRVKRSASRNAARPRPTVTNGSVEFNSVQTTGRDRRVPSAVSTVMSLYPELAVD